MDARYFTNFRADRARARSQWREARPRFGVLRSIGLAYRQMLGRRRLIRGGGERELCRDLVGDMGYRNRAEMTRGELILDGIVPVVHANGGASMCAARSRSAFMWMDEKIEIWLRISVMFKRRRLIKR